MNGFGLILDLYSKTAEAMDFGTAPLAVAKVSIAERASDESRGSFSIA